jgi:hypothetical protein
MTKIKRNSNNARAVRLKSRKRKLESRRLSRIQNNKLIPDSIVRRKPARTKPVDKVTDDEFERNISDGTFIVEAYRCSNGEIVISIFDSNSELLCQVPEKEFKGFMDGFFKKVAKTA